MGEKKKAKVKKGRRAPSPKLHFWQRHWPRYIKMIGYRSTSLPDVYVHGRRSKILFGYVDLDVNLFKFCSAVSTRGHQLKGPWPRSNSLAQFL